MTETVFRPYDVLQVSREGAWVDFSTLRGEADFRDARRILARGWEGFTGHVPPSAFRVVRGDTVVWPI